MITLSEEKPCIDQDIVKDLHDTYKCLQDEPKNTLEHTLQYYIDKQYEFDEELRKECLDESSNGIVSSEIIQDSGSDS